MLKLKITKAEFEALPEALQALYKGKGSSFNLDVERDETDAIALREANARIVALEGEVSARKDFVDPANVPDVARITADLEAARTAHAADVSSLQGVIATSLITSKATEIATKISKNPTIMKRFISDRLAVEFDGSKPVMKVRDAEGAIGETSFDDLAKEFMENPDFGDIIIASNAGGAQSNEPNPKPPASKPDEAVSPSRMSPAQLVEYIKSKKGV